MTAVNYAHASVRATFRLGHPDYRVIAAGCRLSVLNIGLTVSEAAAATPWTICQIGLKLHNVRRGSRSLGVDRDHHLSARVPLFQITNRLRHVA